MVGIPRNSFPPVFPNDDMVFFLNDSFTMFFVTTGVQTVPYLFHDVAEVLDMAHLSGGFDHVPTDISVQAGV